MDEYTTNLQTTTGTQISHPAVAIVQPPRSLPKWDDRSVLAYTDAFESLLDLIGPDIRPKDVKVSKGRLQHDTISGYLHEIDKTTLARTCALLEQVADCVPFRCILLNKGWMWLRLVVRSYPVLAFALQMAQNVRESRFAEASLDTLGEFAVDTDPQTRASAVKANEILLKTYHPDHKKNSAKSTEVGSTRPLFVINTAHFYTTPPEGVANSSPKPPNLGEVVSTQ